MRLSYSDMGLELRGRTSSVRSTKNPRQCFLVFAGEMLRVGKPYRAPGGSYGLRCGRSLLTVLPNGNVYWEIDSHDVSSRTYWSYPGDDLGQHYLAELIRERVVNLTPYPLGRAR